MVVEGPLVPGADFDRLSVVAAQAGTGAPLATATLEGAELRLPARFNFESGPATPAGTPITVRATAERAGVVRSTVSGQATLTEKGGAQLTLTLPAIPPPPDAGTAVEACDNGLDDDGDGLSDCADPQCEGRGCLQGGLTCGGGVCGCGSQPVGVPVARTAFARRREPVALVPRVGPWADALVVAGGRDAQGNPSALVEIHTVSGRLATSMLTEARAEASMVALGDGSVGVLGGVRAGGAPEPSLELLQEGGTTRIPFSPALTARGAAASPLGGEVLLAGGVMATAQAGGAQQPNLAVRVTPGTGAQEVLGPLSLHCPAGGAPLGSSFLLAGGCPGSGATARTDVIGSNGTLGVGPALPVALEGPAVVGLSRNRALVVGGLEQVDGALVPSARAFLFEASGGVVRVREALPLDEPLPSPRAARAGNGWVYVEDATGAPAVWFDPAAERFTPATPVPPRSQHALTGGTGPQVYMAGGVRADGQLDDSLVVLELRCL